MQIVMVGPFGMRPRGTMGVRALPMARALVERGHAVTMVMPPWQNREDAGRCWREGGVEIENIPLPPGAPGLFHLLTARRLVRRALALRPDAVHLFKPKAYSGLAHWLLAHLPRSRRPRLVVDADDWEGPGGWNAIADYSPAQQRFFTWQERWGLTHADAVTVASRTLQSLVWALGAPPARVFYAPNGIAGDGEERQTGVEKHDAPTILLYTRFFEFPVSRVIEVFKRVRERMPDARLIIVGQGLFGEETELFRLAVRAGWTVETNAGDTPDAPPVQPLTHDITYVGWAPAETLPAYFARADIAIYPFDDTLVNRSKCAVKLCDLLAAGVTVAAEAVGENREMIRHGETGWLTPPGDMEAFADAALQLLTDERLRERLGQAAAHDMRRRRSWAVLVETVERAYGVSREVG